MPHLMFNKERRSSNAKYLIESLVIKAESLFGLQCSFDEILKQGSHVDQFRFCSIIKLDVFLTRVNVAGTIFNLKKQSFISSDLKQHQNEGRHTSQIETTVQRTIDILDFLEDHSSLDNHREYQIELELKLLALVSRS
jgi:hypothetical protein